MFERLISEYTLDNYPLLLSSALTFALGYIEYVYSYKLVTTEGRAPYPVWMHTFYFAHDTTWAIRLFYHASLNNWNWFLLSTSVALFVWNLFEVFALWKAVTIERDDIWKSYMPAGKTISTRAAVLSIVEQILAFYCVINLLIEFMGSDPLMEIFLLTNVLIATGPGELWRRKKDRRGLSVGLATVIVVGTINSFQPWSMWVLSMPEVFDTKWYYLSGVVCTGISVRNLMSVCALPEKKWRKGEARPIW